MTTLSTTGTPVPIAPEAATRGPLAALRGFFRYHGALAPAVRLLRNLPFHGKIAVVALAFGASTLVLAVSYQQQADRAREDLARQAAGLAQTRALAPLMDAIAQRRQALAGLPVPPAATGDDPLAALRAVRAVRALGSVDAWQALEQAWQAAAAPPADPGRGRAVLVATLDAVRTFQIDVTSDAGLGRHGRDADAGMSTLASTDLPALRDASLRVLDLLLAGATGTEAAAGPSPELLARRWITSAALESLQRHLDHGEHALPPVVEAAGREAVVATRALLARVAPQGASAGGDRAADAAAALAALRAQGAFEQRLGEALEASIAAHAMADRRALVATAGTVLALLAVGVYLLVGFQKVMAGGLRNLSSEVQRMAAGDLSARPQARGHDEVAEALVSLGGSLTLLSEMFATVRQGVASVAQASGAIARGNGDLAERTERTTRQLEQVVASVNLYMEQLDQSARRVDEAAQLVEAMRMDAARSRHNMAQLQARMNDLQGKSREIGAIVTVIDNIAFRTNVLALNASIEAAKAGETGRGFAVVAQEVRRLARRSAESARDIQDIVSRSTEDIVQGATLADRTGAALRDTDVHVARVHESMQQIVQLTRGGEANSRSILQSIHELNRLTDENNQLVEQIAEASVALSGSGDELSRRVSSFKLT